MKHLTHLAQINIAKLKYDVDDSRVGDFVAGLDFINGIAEKAEGFVWRYQDDSGNATAMQAFPDPRIIVNLSVWKDVETLERFVWKTVHVRFYNRRDDWFDKLDGNHFVMWRVAKGHIPTVEEAKQRLDHFNEHGPSDFAFGWETIPQAKLWKSKRCA